MAKTSTLLLIGAALVAVGVATWMHRAEPAAEPGAPESAAPVVDAQQPTPVSAQSMPAPGRAPAAAAYAPLPPSPESMEATQRAQAQETIARMEKIWSADRPDAAEVRQIEQDLVGISKAPRVLEVREQPLSVDAIGCRASMCRIEATFPTQGGGGDWTTRMMMEMGGTFGASTQVSMPAKDGKSKVILYAFRLGKEPRR